MYFLILLREVTPVVLLGKVANYLLDNFFFFAVAIALGPQKDNNAVTIITLLK